MAQTQFPERARVDNADNGYLVVQRNLDFLRDTVDGNVVPDATNTVKGKIKLAGDLAGSADSPQIAAGAIVNADIADAAGIEGHKLNFHIGAAPPGSPSDGDMWLYPVSSGGYWMFVYSSAAATYKWLFVGGFPWWVQDLTDRTVAWGQGVWQQAYTPALQIALPRAGYYLCEASCSTRPAAACSVAWGLSFAGANPAIYDGTFCAGGYAPVAGARVPFKIAGVYGPATAGTNVVLIHIQSAPAQNMSTNNRYLSVLPMAVI